MPTEYTRYAATITATEAVFEKEVHEVIHFLLVQGCAERKEDGLCFVVEGSIYGNKIVGAEKNDHIYKASLEEGDEEVPILEALIHQGKVKLVKVGRWSSGDSPYPEEE